MERTREHEENGEQVEYVYPDGELFPDAEVEELRSDDDDS